MNFLSKNLETFTCYKPGQSYSPCTFKTTNILARGSIFSSLIVTRFIDKRLTHFAIFLQQTYFPIVQTHEIAKNTIVTLICSSELFLMTKEFSTTSYKLDASTNKLTSFLNFSVTNISYKYGHTLKRKCSVNL